MLEGELLEQAVTCHDRTLLITHDVVGTEITEPPRSRRTTHQPFGALCKPSVEPRD